MITGSLSWGETEGNGTTKGREESIELIKKNTRHFAKRQLTWFRKEEDVIWIYKPDFAYDDTKILEYMKGCMHERNL